MERLLQTFQDFKVSKSTVYNFIRRECNLPFKKAQFQPIDRKERGIKRLKLSTPFENAIIPAADCIHTNSPSNNAAFNEIMTRSLYRQLLAFESYTQITKGQLKLLNAHWRNRTWMLMAASQLLAGATLVDGKQALLLNSVKPYSRYPSIDTHFEKVQPTDVFAEIVIMILYILQ